jgi:hypothetical protein
MYMRSSLIEIVSLRLHFVRVAMERENLILVIDIPPNVEVQISAFKIEIFLAKVRLKPAFVVRSPDAWNLCRESPKIRLPFRGLRPQIGGKDHISTQ